MGSGHDMDVLPSDSDLRGIKQKQNRWKIYSPEMSVCFLRQCW